MSLSKVLQKMAEKHQYGTEVTHLNNNNTSTEQQESNSPGILLSLLTEPPQRKMMTAKVNSKNHDAVSQDEAGGRHEDSGGQDRDSSHVPGGQQNGASQGKGESGGEANRSVLLQLLKEKTLFTKTVKNRYGGREPELPNAGPAAAAAVEPTPIVIKPTDIPPGVPNSSYEDETEGEPPPPGRGESGTATVCSTCRQAFTEAALYKEHLESHHRDNVGESAPPTLAGSDAPTAGGASEAPKSVSEGGSDVLVARSPVSSESDENGLRRSKRKRVPARLKYTPQHHHQHHQDPAENGEEPCPLKILCTEGGVKDTGLDEGAHAGGDDSAAVSVKSGDDRGGGCCSEASSSERPLPPSASRTTTEVLKEEEDTTPEEEEEMELGEDGGSSYAVKEPPHIDHITSYRCSQCLLYFNTEEEAGKHMHDVHDVAYSSDAWKQSQTHATTTTSQHQPCCPCSRCGRERLTQQPLQCLICGKKQTPGVRNLVSVFRVRTWSSRYHQLAKRLSEAMGCKVAPDTCLSKHMCLGCIQKLQNIEKANMQRKQMVRSMKRTNLVSTAVKATLSKKKPKEYKSCFTQTGLQSLRGDPQCGRHAPGERGANSRAAPLVRELLSAPEVVLPQSQFTELIDALSGDKESAASSSLSHRRGNSPPSTTTTATAASSSSAHPPPSAESRMAGIGKRLRQSRRQHTLQHDEAAFNEFINELQAHRVQSSKATANSSASSSPPSDHHQHRHHRRHHHHRPGLHPEEVDIGRVLAEVRVKHEPDDEDHHPPTHHRPKANHATAVVLDQTSMVKSLGLVPAHPTITTTTAAAAAADTGDEDFAETMSLLQDFSSMYTRLQIDSHSGQTEFSCTLCSNAFYSESAIQLHVKCHVPNSKELQCFLCGYHNALLPSQWRIMKRHLETEHEFPDTYFHRFPCPVKGCAQLFKAHRDMVLHVSKVHRSPLRTIRAHALADQGLFDFPCSLCGTLLQSEAALEVHLLCHNGSPKHYQCCYCNYMHTSQPGSWRIMRGHLSKDHIGKELASDIFSYHECTYYACRMKFCSKKAQLVHRACHDETIDGEFFCFVCHYAHPNSPFLWDKVKEHIISQHPEAVGETFRCTCKQQFSSYQSFLDHVNQTREAGSKD